MPAQRKYPQELRDRAVRLVYEGRKEENEPAWAWSNPTGWPRRCYPRRVMMIEPVVESAPWWSAGFFVIVGAVLGFLFNLLNDVRKSRREDRLRWHQELLSACSELLVIARDIYLDSGRYDNVDKATQSADSAKRELDHFVQFGERMSRFIHLSAQIEILGSFEVVNAAFKLRRAANEAGKKQTQDRESVSEALNDAMVRFTQEVRKHLGVGAFRLPKSTPLS